MGPTLKELRDLFLVNCFSGILRFPEHRKNSAEAQGKGPLSLGVDAKPLEAVGEIKSLNSDVSCGADDDTSLDSLSPEKEAPVPQLISDPSNKYNVKVINETNK